MDGANKSRLGDTNKGEVGGTNIEAGVGINRANKGSMSRADIETGRKAGAGAVASTNNNADGGDKVTDEQAGFTDLAFATFTTADYPDNSNPNVSKETTSGAAISTFDKFLAIFAALVNTTLKRKSKMYEFNLFLFTANH